MLSFIVLIMKNMDALLLHSAISHMCPYGYFCPLGLVLIV